MPIQTTFLLKLERNMTKGGSAEDKVEVTDGYGNVVPEHEGSYNIEDMPEDAKITEIKIDQEKSTSDTKIIGVQIATYNPTRVWITLSNGTVRCY